MNDNAERPMSPGVRVSAILFWTGYVLGVITTAVDYFPDAKFDYVQEELILGAATLSGLVSAIVCHKLERRA